MIIQNKKAKQLHDQAMIIGDEAYINHIQRGDKERTKELYNQAYRKEHQAALLLVDDFDAGLARGIIFQSAGYFAYHADLLKEAKIMLQLGLAGEPPSPIYERLLQLHLDILDKEERRKKGTKPANESIATMMGILRKLPAEVRQQAEDFVESLATKYLRVQ